MKAWRAHKRETMDGKRPGSRLLSLLLAALLAPWFAGEARGQTGTLAEYEIKAALLYKVMNYVEWPAEALGREPAFTIGVVGDDPDGKLFTVLNGVLPKKTFKGKKIVVKQLSDTDDWEDCQMLYIASSEKRRLPDILERTAKINPVLVVGEVAGFAERGGHVNLVSGMNSVNLEINNSAASKSGLSISPQLLKLRLVKVIRR